MTMLIYKDRKHILSVDNRLTEVEILDEVAKHDFKFHRNFAYVDFAPGRTEAHVFSVFDFLRERVVPQFERNLDLLFTEAFPSIYKDTKKFFKRITENELKDAMVVTINDLYPKIYQKEAKSIRDGIASAALSTRTSRNLPIEEQVLEEYFALANKRKFAGVQPVTISASKITPNTNYAITKKLDGQRFLMIPFKKQMYLISSKLTVHPFPCNYTGAEKFILDGELYKNEYHIFDIITEDPLELRLEHIHRILKECKTCVNMKLKEYYIGDLYENFKKLSEKLNTNMYDGLIIIKTDTGYQGSSPLKWKPVEMNTIDFHISKRPDNHFSLGVVDRTGNLKEFEVCKINNSDYNMYNDGEIAEFMYVTKTKCFKPIKRRPDKDKPNFIDVAQDNMQAIRNPFDQETLRINTGRSSSRGRSPTVKPIGSKGMSPVRTAPKSPLGHAMSPFELPRQRRNSKGATSPMSAHSYSSGTGSAVTRSPVPSLTESEKMYATMDDMLGEFLPRSRSPSPPPVHKKQGPVNLNVSFFNTSVVKFRIQLTSKLDDSFKLKPIYYDITLSSSLLSVGTIIDGYSKYQKFETEDKKLKQLIKRFSTSEDDPKKPRELKSYTIYFLYNLPSAVIDCVMNNKGYCYAIVRPKANVNVSIQELPAFSNRIIRSLDDLMLAVQSIAKVNLIENVSSPYDIQIKLEPIRTGKLNIDLIYDKISRIKIFPKLKRILQYIRGVIVVPGTKGNQFTISNKDDILTIHISRIDDINQSVDIVNSFDYEFRQLSNNVTETTRKEKLPVKVATEQGIKVNSRDCQKGRQHSTLRDNEDPPAGRQVMVYEGKRLVCDDINAPGYPFPGFTTKGNVCCFKTDQRHLAKYKAGMSRATGVTSGLGTVTGSLETQGTVSKILNTYVVAKDHGQFMNENQRTRIVHPILRKIFSTENFYILGVGGQDTITNCLEKAFGSNVIQQAIRSTTDKVFKSFGLKGVSFREWTNNINQDLLSIIKAVAHYKKVNILVIQTDKKTRILCSETEFFDYDETVVIVGHGTQYRLLIKEEGCALTFKFMYDSEEMQRLITLYNKTCFTSGCNKETYSVTQIQRKLKVHYQVVNVFDEVNYVLTDYGFLPVNPGPIDYRIESRPASEITFLPVLEQYNHLLEISKRLPYLEPVGQITDARTKVVKGIEVQCKMVVPVQQAKTNLPLQGSSKTFYPELNTAIKSNLVSQRALSNFKKKAQDNYYSAAKEAVMNYLRSNRDKLKTMTTYKKAYNNMAELIVPGNTGVTKESIPLEKTVPFVVPAEIYEYIKNRLAWEIAEEGVTAKSPVAGPSIPLTFIKNKDNTQIG